MTEVDAVMSEDNSLIIPTPKPTENLEDSTVTTTVTATATNVASVRSEKSEEQQNGGKSNEKDGGVPMEVDGEDVDEDEDDSQITSSTENGGSAVAGADQKVNNKETRNVIVTEGESEGLGIVSVGESGDGPNDKSKTIEEMPKLNTTSTELAGEKIELQDKQVAALKTANECSSNVSEDNEASQNSLNEKVDDESQDSVVSSGKQPCHAKDDDEEGSVKSNGNSNSNSEQKKPSSVVHYSDTDGDASQSQDEDQQSATNHNDSKSHDGDTANKVKDLSEAVSSSDERLPDKVQKENGVASNAEKAVNDTISGGGIVDLDDDSDEEEDLTDAAPVKTTPKQSQSPSNGDSQQPLNMANNSSNDNKTPKSICSDSDGAVVIGSDSESEAAVTVTNADKSKQVTQITDDEDDDCVVIEDDTPPISLVSDINKRKSLAMNSPNTSDDSQPPSKKQRSAPPANSINQITIKDARSLMPQEVGMKKAGDGGVYPINITSAQGVLQPGPPKLVPMANPVGMSVPGLPGLSSNANLLPGLTDDMFVLEAPSFIVPYIYEKPPSNRLKEIVQEIESVHKFTKEDLAEADKSDEFDMVSEQNKEEKEEKNGKKKKRSRGGDADDSWSEESDEDDDDDDDDSESGVRTKVLIKEATDDLTALKGAIKPAAAVVSSTVANATTVKAGQENYFESPLGKFFMDIGVGLVQEYVQSDLIRLQKRKMRKSLGKNITEFERAIAALSGNLEASKKKNAPFKFTMKRCEFCNFKSESALALANHYETPHMNGAQYKCNFCAFEIRNASEIVYHMEAIHNIKARLIKPLPYHQCPNCGFEDNGKAKLARHQPVCAKKFRPELNLAPPNDWEAPAKIPRIKPRHGLVGTATAYQAMAAQAAAQKAALASIQQQQAQAAQARSLQAAALAAQNAVNRQIRGRPPQITKPGPVPGPMLRGPSQVRNPMATNVVMPNNYHLPSGQLGMQPAASNAMTKKTLPGQPSISITPLPRQSAVQPQVSSPSTSKMPPAGMKPGQSPAGGNKAQFVICEICDGYIKDLEQLRNHMQWMHKVKIHPKMIYNRPPLNCQKCQFRFFTDQGLERHLLGSHGLVTSSMQEAANKGKDAGRCPVCGRMYQWKLLNHVSRDHHMTLKPAHLSYKCTVCTATFGMYKQFETHVYTAHSTVAKKAMDSKKNSTAPMNASGASSSSNQRSNLVASNDSLLKPLKINDEITIIPQPASKPRITNIESHVID